MTQYKGLQEHSWSDLLVHTHCLQGRQGRKRTPITLCLPHLNAISSSFLSLLFLLPVKKKICCCHTDTGLHFHMCTLYSQGREVPLLLHEKRYKQEGQLRLSSHLSVNHLTGTQYSQIYGSPINHCISLWLACLVWVISSIMQKHFGVPKYH